MKQETGKKSKLWLWIVIAVVALLAVAGVVLGILFLQPAEPNEDPVDQVPESEVYWNVDKTFYTKESETGLSTRDKGEDGLYHFRLASQGKLMELATADKQLVNYMDTMDTFGLVLDADGLIIDALDVKTIAVETAKSFYIKTIKGSTVTVNSSIAMNGMDIVIELTDNVYVMDVREGTETLGQSIELNVMDVVNVYGSEENPAESIFVTERPDSSPLYLRVDRLYDAATALTKRVPDENGVYTIPFAVNGKIEQLKCKDMALVTAIDAGTDTKQVMGLTFDEEGYINGTIVAATAIRGKIACTVYNVTAINGNAIEVTRLLSGNDQGKVVNFNLTEDTQIIMNEADCKYFIGERVPTLEMDDRIIVWTDMENNALYIKVDRRRHTEAEMYYNQYRKYDSVKLETARVPDANGYYVFELAHKGKMVTLKTKDKALASRIDADTWQFFGLVTQGNIIKEYCTKDCITGGYGVGGTTRYVTQVMSNIIQLSNGNFETLNSFMLTSETEIYDMTGDPGTKLGSKTKLQLGDRVIAARDVLNNMTHIYVLDRYYEGCKMYYNASRKWNSTTLETSRVPETEGENAGYYVFTMYCEGKEVVVKTKSKDIANAIDEQNAPIVAMKVSNGIVKAAYPAVSGMMYGVKRFNYNFVGEITPDKTVSCYYFMSATGEKVDASASYKMAKDCKIYNVSSNFSDHRGEKATLKVGDRIQALQDFKTGELTHIWIMTRLMDSPLYLNFSPKYNSKEAATTRVPNAEGYYEVELFVDGKIKTFKTKDKDLMSQVDKNSGETFFAMEVKGDIIQKVDAYSASKRGMNIKVSFQDVMKISGKTITTERKRPGQTNTGATTEFTYNSKTQIYDISYYSGENRFKPAKLQKGDRISVYTDMNGNITYIFVMYPHLREKGYESKCSHCNKTVWWEPYTGSFITTAGEEIVHYYVPADYTRAQVSVGASRLTNPDNPRFTVVLDLNGTTTTSTGRNFLVYNDLIVIDSVGGGVLQANGVSGGYGGNFLIPGGTVTLCDGVTIRQNSGSDTKAGMAGNAYVQNQYVKGNEVLQIGKLIIEDAVLEGWDCKKGGNIVVDPKAELIIKGGTIKGGDIKVAEGGIVKLNGKVQILGEGIDLTAGAKIAESKLTAGSKVLIQANGIFTEKLSNINAQKGFYEAESKFYPIQVKDGALWTDRDPSKPDYVAEPEIPELPALTKVDNTALALDANKQAKCPVCNKVVTWTAITDTAAVQNLVNGLHYYLPADVTFEKADHPYIQVAEGVSTCLHLNEHNITATKAMAVLVNGNLNIMGNGIVSGNGYDNEGLLQNPHLHAATIETNAKTAVLNMYGGTYVKSAENNARVVKITTTTDGVSTVVEKKAASHIVGVHGNGGTINMFEGALVDGSSNETYTVRTFWGMFNLYGGKVVGDKSAAIVAGNWNADKTGSASVYGGTVQAGSGYSMQIVGIASAPANGYIYGGEFIGTCNYNADANLVIAGNPVISRLSMPTNRTGAYDGLITLGKMTDGAHIKVHGTGSISFQNENGADYVKYFESLTGVEIVYQYFAVGFYEEPKPELPAVPEVMPAVTEDLQFIGNSSWALCPLCKDYVKWTPITQTMYGTSAYGTATKGTHLYLPDDFTYTGTTTFINAPGGNADNTACIHLNGHNFTATKATVAHGSYGKLNILGTGVVSGNGSAGAAITINTNQDYLGGMFLHSGTYTKAVGNTKGVVQVNSNGGRIWVGKDATIVTVPGDLAASVSAGGFNINGTLYIAGTVEGGYVQSNKVTLGKDVTAASAILVLDGANLKGGAKIAQDTELALMGETQVGGSGLDMTSGALITASELSGDAMVAVAAKGAFSEKLPNVNEQLKFYTNAYKYKPVEVKSGALWTEEDPDAVIKPPADMPALTDNLEFLAGTKMAVCPLCEKYVEWTPITQAAYGEKAFGTPAGTGAHLYLAEDITYTGTTNFINSPSRNTETDEMYYACLHLNGHNLTATNSNVAHGSYGKLNFMGTGTVSGNGAAGATITINTNRDLGGGIFLHSGTYTKPAGNSKGVVQVNSNGGRIWVGKDATIVTNSGALAASVAAGGFNINGTLHIEGTVEGGYVQSNKVTLGKDVTAASAILELNGANLKGGAKIANDTVLKLLGETKIADLDLTSGAKIAESQLSGTAQVSVAANGVFSAALTNVNDQLAFYTNANGYKKVEIKEGALWTELDSGVTPDPDPKPEPDPEPEIPADPKVPAMPSVLKVDNSNLNLVDGKAKCPVCDKEVEWTAITGIDATLVLEGNKHYYLANDITYTGKDYAIAYYYNKAYSGMTTCLHLNGKKLTSENVSAIHAGMRLNIMGEGIVTGNTTVNNYGAALQINSSAALVNLYGGTYTKAAACQKPVVSVFDAGGTLNIFDSVEINNKDMKGNSVQAINGTINMYGGTVYGGASDSCILAGNINSKYSTVNIFGGKVQAFAASGISCNPGSSMNVYGGQVLGGSAVVVGANWIIGGTASMNRLVINKDAKITLAEMSEGASVTVSASGIFSNPSNNANTYVKYFKGLSGYKTPTVVENALFTEQGTDPVVPDPKPEPEPEQPENTKVDNSNLNLVDGKAKCTVCNKEVVWTPITQAEHGENGVGNVTTAGMHYYLAEDINFTGVDNFIRGPGSKNTLCIHLNGHNFTATQGRFLFGYASITNVMGNGVVAGGINKAKEGAVQYNTATAGAVINLYGGTYTTTTANTKGSVIVLAENGGEINLFEGVKVISRNGAAAIYVNKAGLVPAIMNIDGAVIEGDIVTETPVKNTADWAANLVTANAGKTNITLKDTSVNMVTLAKGVTFTVAGNTTIEKLIVKDNAKLTVGELGSAASINVSGNGVISETNSKLSTYFGSFKSTYGCELSVKDNALVARDLNKIDNSALKFEEGTTKALCPYCQETVEWTAIQSTDTYLKFEGSKHLYLAADITVTADASKDGFLHMQFPLNKIDTDKICLHMNGHNLTVNGNRAVMGGPGNLNIMGQGTLSGDKTLGATIHLNGTKATGTVSLFGGTYVKPATNLKGNVAQIGGNGGTLNIYAGATIDGGNIENNEVAAVYAAGSTGSAHSGNAVVNMYGGTIQNGNNVKSHGGNIRLNTAYAFFNMYGGTVTGGKAPGYYGGNIYSVLGTVKLMGGTISNGEARIGGNVAVQNTATDSSGSLILQNVTILNGASVSHGGSVSSDYAPITIGVGTVIDGGHAQGQGGNVRNYCGNITMNGGIIRNGQADNAAGNANIWIVSDKDAIQPVMRMNGGVIYAVEGAKTLGSGIHIGARASLYLANGATVVDAAGATMAGIRVDSVATNKLRICNGWYGSATVGYATVYAAGAAIPAAGAQVVTLDADLKETVGGTISGSLAQLKEGLAALELQADGTFKVAAAG